MRKYKMTKKECEGLFRVTMTADLNDADYMTDVTEYTEDEFEGVLDELIEINELVGVDNAIYDYETSYEVNIPFEGQSGQSCHTLESLKIEYISSDGVIYDVELGDEG